jgi:hypothetical protein
MTREKVYTTNAEKQRAYRDRKRNAVAATIERVTFDDETTEDDESTDCVDYGIPYVVRIDYGAHTKRCSICGIQNFWQVCRSVRKPNQWYAYSVPDYWTRARRLNALIRAGRIYPHEWVRFTGDICDFCK